MTLTIRNYILTGALIFSAFLFLSALAGTIVTLYSIVPPQTPGLLFTEVYTYPHLQTLLLLALPLLSLTAGILMYISFRKTASPEIFFFLIFLLTLGLEASRILIIFFETRGGFTLYQTFLTRTVYFGRLLALFSLVMAGLFNLGFQYQKMEALLGFITVIAMLLAATLPIDTSAINDHFLFPFGFNSEIVIISLILSFFGILNFFLSGIKNHSRDHLAMGFCLVLVLGGWDILCLSPSLFLQTAGIILIAAGTLLFGRVTHEVYLWT